MGERATSSQATKPSRCFIYDGPHRVRDCPRKEKLNAVIAEDGENFRSELLTGGQKIVSLVDSGATHNFISTRETTRLGLKLAKDDSKLKDLNS